jgi:hypothetical protein
VVEAHLDDVLRLHEVVLVGVIRKPSPSRRLMLPDVP